MGPWDSDSFSTQPKTLQDPTIETEELDNQESHHSIATIDGLLMSRTSKSKLDHGSFPSVPTVANQQDHDDSGIGIRTPDEALPGEEFPYTTSGEELPYTTAPVLGWFGPRSTDIPRPEPETVVYSGSTDIDAEEDEARQPIQKRAHNVIEKSYQGGGLNEKIAALRDSVPSLRAISKTTEDGDNQRDNEGIQGFVTAHRLSKGTVLSKATEYIRDLEERNSRLLAEKCETDVRLSQFEKLLMQPPSSRSVISQDSGYAHLHQEHALNPIQEEGLHLTPTSAHDRVDSHPAPSQGARPLESSIHSASVLDRRHVFDPHGNARGSGITEYDGFQGLGWETGSQAGSDWNVSDRSLDTQDSQNPLWIIREAAVKVLFDAFVCRSYDSPLIPNKFEGEANDQEGSGNKPTHGRQQSNTASASKAHLDGQRKRTRDPSDGNDDGDSRASKRLSKGKGVEPERLLACPFCKNDPINFRVCYRYVLKSISRLK